LQQYLSILGALTPTLTTALMSIGKVVAIATLFKLLTIMNADISPFQLIIVIISMASMTGKYNGA
jgi:NADH-quinone oxidoreductase subunit N